MRAPEKNGAAVLANGATPEAWLTEPECAHNENIAQLAPDSYRKRVDGLRARFALLGWELHLLAGEQFIACRWGKHRLLDDVESAERFLTQIGGRHG